MRNDKKGEIGSATIIIGMLIVALIIGGAIWLGFSGVQESITVTSTETTTTATGLPVECGETPTVSAYFRVQNSELTTATYLANATGYWVGHDTATKTQTGGPDVTGSYSTTAATLNCGSTYDLYVVDKANTNSYGVIRDIVVGVTPVYETVELPATSALKARIKDLDADSFWRTAGNSTDFANLASTWTYKNDGTTTLDVTAGGTYDLELYLKTQTADTVFGLTGEGVFVCVDAASSKWQEPDLGLGDSVKDADHFTSDDLTALADYEYCYPVGEQIVDSTSVVLPFNIKAVEAVDPGATDDLKIRFVAVGAKLSSDNPETVYLGVFDDSSSHTEIQGTTEELTIDEVA